MTTIHLARHGRTAWHSGNRYAGRTDIELDEVGFGQAAQLAEWAAGAKLAALACSPLRRAIQTAQPAAAAIGLSPIIDPRLRELDFGIAEGRTLDEMRAEHSHAVEGFVSDPAANPFPGGEAPTDAASRALAAITDMAERFRGRDVLIVAHSTVIRLVLCTVLGVPLGEYRRRFPAMAPGGRTELRFGVTVGLMAYNVPLGRGCTA